MDIRTYIDNIHDWIVKLVLGRPANMRSVLQACLSKETVGRVDWDRIAYMPTELQRADGRVLRADIVVKLPLPGGGRYIAVLEHKSSFDPGTRYQVNSYVVAIEQEHDARGMVIPIVFYHGDTPWTEVSEAGPAEAWDFRMIVLSVGDEVLRGAQLTVEARALMEVLRAGRGVSEAAVLTELARDYLRPVYKQYGESKVVFDELVRYILSVAERAKGLTSEEILRIIEEQIGKEAREMGKSFLQEAWEEGERAGVEQSKSFLQEAWEEGERAGVEQSKSFLQEAWEEGERIGIDKGERTGIDKGRTEGRTEVAQRMLREHVDEALIRRVTGLAPSEIDAMRHSLNGS